MQTWIPHDRCWLKGEESEQYQIWEHTPQKGTKTAPCHRCLRRWEHPRCRARCDLEAKVLEDRKNHPTNLLETCIVQTHTCFATRTAPFSFSWALSTLPLMTDLSTHTHTHTHTTPTHTMSSTKSHSTGLHSKPWHRNGGRNLTAYYKPNTHTHTHTCTQTHTRIVGEVTELQRDPVFLHTSWQCQSRSVQGRSWECLPQWQLCSKVYWQSPQEPEAVTRGYVAHTTH